MVHGVEPRGDVVPLALAALVPRRADRVVIPRVRRRERRGLVAHRVSIVLHLVAPSSVVQARVDVRESRGVRVRQVPQRPEAHRARRGVVVHVGTPGAVVGAGVVRAFGVDVAVAVQRLQGERDLIAIRLLILILQRGALALCLAVPPRERPNVALDRTRPLRVLRVRSRGHPTPPRASGLNVPSAVVASRFSSPVVSGASLQSRWISSEVSLHLPRGIHLPSSISSPLLPAPQPQPRDGLERYRGPDDPQRCRRSTGRSRVAQRLHGKNRETLVHVTSVFQRKGL